MNYPAKGVEKTWQQPYEKSGRSQGWLNDERIETTEKSDPRNDMSSYPWGEKGK